MLTLTSITNTQETLVGPGFHPQLPRIAPLLSDLC